MKGPYEIIRHPIYAGLLLIMAGFVEGYLSLPRLLAFAVILAATIMKLEHDEEILKDVHPEYKKYQSHTYRFIPYLY